MATHYFGTVESDETGRPVAGASVSVLTGPSSAGGTAVDLFSDESVTAITNPVTTDPYGYYSFYVADGHYTLEFSYNGTVFKTIEDVEIAETNVGALASLELRMDAAEIVTSNATVVAFTGLADPNIDRLPFWDESANTFAWLEVGAGLSLSGTTLTTTGAGSGDITTSGLTMATARLLGRTTAASGAVEEITAGTALTLAGGVLSVDMTAIKPTESLIIACSDETTALTAGTAKVTFRMPYAFNVSAVRASLGTAQTSGLIFTVDINEAGLSILSTKLTIDNTEKTSTTAVTLPVISDSALADDAEITIDIDQIGDGTAKGLKVYLIGTRT